MSGTQRSPYASNPSPTMHYRNSFSPPEQDRYRAPIHHGHPQPPPHPQQPYPPTNGHANQGPPAPAQSYPERAYYDPVGRSPEVPNGQWNNYQYPTRPPPPPLSTQSLPHPSYDVVRDTSVDPASAHSQLSHHSSEHHSTQNNIASSRLSEDPAREQRGVAAGPEGAKPPAWNQNSTESKQATPHRSNRMNISSLLSNPTEEAPPSSSSVPHTPVSPAVSKASSYHPAPAPPAPASIQSSAPPSLEPEQRNGTKLASKPVPKPGPKTSVIKMAPAAVPAQLPKRAPEPAPSFLDSQTSFSTVADNASFNHKFKDFKYHESMSIDSVDTEKADTEIDEEVYAHDLEVYKSKRRKRKRAIIAEEAKTRKRRMLLFSLTVHDQFESAAREALELAKEKIYPEAAGIIRKKEEEYGKERKKTLQQNRRKEKQDEARRAKAEQQAKVAAEMAEKRRRDDEERARLRAENASMDDDSILDGHDSDNSAAIIYDDEGARTKKRRIVLNKKGRGKDAATSVPEKIEPHVSKGYNQMFDQIWRDIARKDIPKVYRTQQSSLNTKQSNLRKTVQLAAKEARRWQLRTNRNHKDTQARAKRTMREMVTFWKRNEKEERDNRRKAEKEAVERAKKEEELRESKRQARKLNFLISQTELYSHFIGRKIKTQELERSTDTATDGAVTETAAEKVPEAVAAGVSGVAGPTNFNELDFDNDDETALHQAAMHNAQTAIREAKEKANAFNKLEEKPDMDMDMDDGEMNFQNPTGLGDIEISQPKLLSCQLKEYQIKGLNWLANLYEQGINGILADEMGLGKTVQSISVMAYLAEKYNIWGPFLVIAPASTLHNWQQEIAKFVPQFKALPYWGNQKDRKTLRKFWDRKSPTYTKDSQFHVCITSYQIVVGDAQYFQKMRWQYMILDEAQAIKSSSSSRWKTLLGMQCRNRLLLTGTPIQNSMQELWALLHFIMPGLFDSHDEFSEWFSKDIESHTQSNTQLNEQQLHRLHMILKPFMLRRIKRHVQKELGEKLELDVYCDLTYRQRRIYKALREKISIMDIVDKVASGSNEGAQSLMNLVMQFRKVCNHPDLFERAEVYSPLSFATFADTISFMREGNELQLYYTANNRISYRVPRLVFREERLDVAGAKTRAGFKSKYLDNTLNIWSQDYLYENSRTNNSAFSFLPFADSSPADASKAFRQDLITRATALTKAKQYNRYLEVYDEEPFVPKSCMLLVSELSRKDVPTITKDGILGELFNIRSHVFQDEYFAPMERDAPPAAVAPPISVVCDDPGTVIEQQNILFDPHVRRALAGPSPLDEARLLENKIEVEDFPNSPLVPIPSVGKGHSNIVVPNMRRFISDSGKLAALDKLLVELKAGGHRVLLYFQMTRMMDLAEEYLSYRKYKYLRLDGSSKVEDRRDMVADFQNKPEIFMFLLSTRAGGLGLNLTAADCVIFYDSDWNPTVDQQAEDRAHRLGQTRQVRVYRLLTRGTIEERIRTRALQKQDVQKVVMTGKATEKKGVDFSKSGGNRDVAMWLFDDDNTFEKELAAKEKEKELEKATKGKGKGKKAKAAAGASAENADSLLESMYHEGEGKFESEAATPASMAVTGEELASGKKKRKGNKKKTAKERLNMIDGRHD